MAEAGGFGAAIRRGAIAGLIFVVVAGGAIAVYAATGHRLPGQGRANADRVLIIGALPDENGDLVARVIADADAGSSIDDVRSVDPSSPVTIVGTSYGRLRDSYAFGGGAAVARAYAQLGGGEPLPYIDLGPEALRAAITAAGGVTLQLSEPMNVFDGDRLFTFPAGAVTADPVAFRAILNGAAYLAPAQRSALMQQAVRAVTELARTYPGGLAAAIEDGTVASDLSAEEAAAFVTGLTQAR
ncbi:MAG: hypothetical protein D9V44_02325 [Actinobacteria bacterium]|nr:MAG: hypothetical protein D9V44_02325 [Actinomycetota bacterium]